MSLRLGYEPGQLRMILLVDREMRDLIEGALLAAALREIRREVVVVEYPTGVAEDTFRRMGFSEQRRLVWMARSLRPAANSKRVAER